MSSFSSSQPNVSWLRTAPGYCWLAESDGRLIAVNDRLKNLMGWRLMQPENKNLFRDLPDEFWSTQKTLLTSPAQHQSPDRDVVVIQKSVWPQSSQPKEIVWTVRSVLTRGGRCRGWWGWGIAADATPFKASQQQANSREWEMWQHLNQFKSEFIATVSHEIRTPIAIVEQLTVPLHDEILGPLNDRQKESLVRLRSQIQRLKLIIEEILDFSKLEQKASILKYSVADLKELIEDAREFYVQLAKEKGLTLTFDLPDESLNLFMDPQRIFQVITNLFNNAVKFTPAGGRIHVEIKRLSNKVRVGVFDTGIGIAPDDVSRIFERFVQLDTGQIKAKGIGLGLSIVREIIQRHGGEIWVESEPGQGSRFYFTLPLYHTMMSLPDSVREAVAVLLRRKQKGVLISALMINYDDLRHSTPAVAAKGLKAMTRVILRTLKKLSPRSQPSHWIDAQKGKVDVVLAVDDERIALALPLIRNRLKEYLKRHTLDQSVFLAVGTVRLESGVGTSIEQAKDTMEMYIGSQMRMHRRVRYTTTVEIIAPASYRQVTQIHDISLGGVCLISKTPIKTDALLRFKLYLNRLKEWIDLEGRVAWFKPEMAFMPARRPYYKVGVEFVALSERQKNILQKELRFYYE